MWTSRRTVSVAPPFVDPGVCISLGFLFSPETSHSSEIPFKSSTILRVVVIGTLTIRILHRANNSYVGLASWPRAAWV